MAKALLIDVTRCIGCGACYEACKEQNNLPLPDEPETELSPTAFTVLQERGDWYVRRLCMHCQDPTCASVCPVGALHKTPEGPVAYDSEKCIGCRYCMLACPFEIPRYEWSKAAPLVRKCIMCYERVRDGQDTACAEVCPEDATTFGERDELLSVARDRIANAPDDYVDHIYGEHEVGGTSTLYITPVDYERLGLRKTSVTEPLPKLTWEVLHTIPSLVMVLGTALAGIWWITGRREEVRRAEGDRASDHDESEVSHE